MYLVLEVTDRSLIVESNENIAAYNFLRRRSKERGAGLFSLVTNGKT